MKPGPAMSAVARPSSCEVVDDFLGQRARVGLALLGEHHGGVGLIVAEAQVRGGGDGGGRGFTERGGQGGGEAGFEILEKRHGGWRRSPGGFKRRARPHGTVCNREWQGFHRGWSPRPSWRRTSPLVNILAIAAKRPQVQVVVLARDDEEDDEVDRRVDRAPRNRAPPSSGRKPPPPHPSRRKTRGEWPPRSRCRC